jgi:TolB protein
MKRHRLHNRSNCFLTAALLLQQVLMLACKDGYRPENRLHRGIRFSHGGRYIGSNPRVSPDGLRVVFGSPGHNLGDIAMVDLDGNNWIRLTSSEAYEGEPTWSPNGESIAFVSEQDGNGEIYVMRRDGGGQIRLTDNGTYDYSPVFSPDGDHIAFVRHAVWDASAASMKVQFSSFCFSSADSGEWRGPWLGVRGGRSRSARPA